MFLTACKEFMSNTIARGAVQGDWEEKAEETRYWQTRLLSRPSAKFVGGAHQILLSRVTYRVNPRDGLVHTVLLSGELEAMLLLPHVRLRRQSQTPELWMMGRLED
mmetsp:Transcript_23860/g.53403  ORF Transcript_23860/g.53403 Transcript_23860/m.53403 type:complete len:106 (-) Transcript_23860:58-375(-)